MIDHVHTTTNIETLSTWIHGIISRSMHEVLLVVIFIYEANEMNLMVKSKMPKYLSTNIA